MSETAMEQCIKVRKTFDSKKIHTVAKCAMSIALMTVSAYIVVPGIGSAVPFTMQTFAIMCVAALLGWKAATVSTLAYILIGAAGLPVFSGMRGGVGVIAGVTGGYIIGFLAMAALTGFLYEKAKGRPSLCALSMTAGIAVCYAFGTAWFVLIYSAKNGGIGVASVLMMCVVPYIVPDALKAVLAMFVAKRVKRILK